jgi:hypothetical protein
MFVVFLASVKHRLFRGVWLEEIEKMEKTFHLKPVPMWTDTVKDSNRYKKTNSLHKLFLDLSAEEWLADVLLVISIVFAILAIVNFHNLINLLF